MKMFRCKTVKFGEDLKTKKVLSLTDCNSHGFTIETHVQQPYRSMLKHLDEVLGFKQHTNIKEALKFHKIMADEIHSKDG